jgi:alanine racemase
MSNVWAEVNLDALRHNLAFIRARVGEDVEIMAVVKADGYGHGAREIVQALIPAGVSWFGVANTLEGIVVRSVDPDIQIMVLGQVFPENVPDIFSYNLTPIVCDYETAEILDREAQRCKKRLVVHVKIDTGMGRIGVWHEDFQCFLDDVGKLTHLKIDGFLSHFPSSDEDAEFSHSQVSIFKKVVSEAAREQIRARILHMANSAAILKLPASYFDMVRPGIVLYGLYPSAVFSEKCDIQPVLSLKTKVSFVKKVRKGMTISYGMTFRARKPTVVATIPAGYGDGYNRHLSNTGRVLIKGKYAPIVGRVTMDQTMVDVGHIPGVKVGDEVVLIGRQGKHEITVEEIARLVDTIPYEIVCGINKRVERVYAGSAGKGRGARSQKKA